MKIAARRPVEAESHQPEVATRSLGIPAAAAIDEGGLS
jgi:hypothetical protein